VDGLVQQKDILLTAVADAIIKALDETVTAQVDALLQTQGNTLTTSVDALLTGGEITVTTSIDALLQKSVSLSAAVDAILEAASGVRRRRPEQSHGTYFISKEGFPRKRLLERHREDEEIAIIKATLMALWN
jgi:hypothetical protein